jgi:hypothetical protein
MIVSEPHQACLYETAAGAGTAPLGYASAEIADGKRRGVMLHPAVRPRKYQTGAPTGGIGPETSQRVRDCIIGIRKKW